MSRRPNLLAQRALVLGHLLGLCLFFGGTAAVLVSMWSAPSRGTAQLTSALELAVRLQRWVLLPGAVAILASGVLMSLTGAWGFVRHWWMVGKLLGSAVLAVHSQLEYGPLTARLLEVVRGAAAGLPADFAHQLFHHQRVGVIQLVVLVLLSALGLFKPLGKTRFGRAGPGR